MPIAQADFWRVNSYGYPNPFSGDPKAQQAWNTLLSFYDFTSYASLKQHWASGNAARIIDPHALESWKATFEEYGLLYVLSRTDEIVITPAGRQFREAAANNQIRQFAWIGLSLLLRYPLRGAARRSRGVRYDQSNLLLYWFLYAAMQDLQDYIWWSELERVLCTVFRVDEAEAAIATIRRLRANQDILDAYPPADSTNTGGFYNTLNQIIVHASMGYLILGRSTDDSFYPSLGKERRHWIRDEWSGLIDAALGGNAAGLDCDSAQSFVSRMPSAPLFMRDEQAYFEYLGAHVNDEPSFMPLVQMVLQGETVPLFKQNEDYTLVSATAIVGGIAQLCRLARGQRIILSHDLTRSYIVENKEHVGSNQIQVVVRKARPITNANPIIALLGEENA